MKKIIVFTTMAFIPPLLLIFMLNLCPEIAQATQHTTKITEKSTLLNYIVHVAKPEGRTLAEFEDLERWYQSFLPVSTATHALLIPKCNEWFCSKTDTGGSEKHGREGWLSFSTA